MVYKTKKSKNTNIKTLKDPHKYDIVDNTSSFTAQFLQFYLKKCDNETSAIPCADFGQDEQELKKYLDSHVLSLMRLVNFVDYDEVEPGVGPVKRAFDFIELVSDWNLTVS